MKNKPSSNVQLVLDVLRDEVKGDVAGALAKLAQDYSMTWVYKDKKGAVFPRSRPNFKKELKEVYTIKNRNYDIKHIAEGDGVVMVELVESYPDPKSKKWYRTPLVLVLEVAKGKIKKGRHYCDPVVSYLNLTPAQIKKIYK